jgi:hypothetical protein
MYWVWTNRRTHEGEAHIYGRPRVIADMGLRFSRGTRIDQDIPLIEIPIDNEVRDGLTDNLIAPATTGLIFSGKLRDVLTSVGVDNIDYYDCVLINKDDGSKNEDYKLANIVGRVACLDVPNSDITWSPADPTAIFILKNFVINEDAIEDLLIFRMDELSTIILVHEKVKKAVVDAGITGIQFFEPSNYRP